MSKNNMRCKQQQRMKSLWRSLQLAAPEDEISETKTHKKKNKKKKNPTDNNILLTVVFDNRSQNNKRSGKAAVFCDFNLQTWATENNRRLTDCIYY